MLPYASTIFVGAFLLFLIQPVIAKQIVPWFGGSASVWATCLVFFQAALLAGYAYSDLVVRRLALRTQVALHSALLAISLALLPVVPEVSWKPFGNEEPISRILGMLAATVGLPYFMLATTSPLVQSWFARARPGASPYRLFALSNAASMAALVGYPFLLEPWVPTRMQALGWSVAYGAYVALCIAAGWVTLRAGAAAHSAPAPAHAEPVMVTAHAGRPPRKHKARKANAPVAAEPEAPPTVSRQALWATLAGAAALLLLAVTNHITQNIASVPLLWILPLGLYLLSFIVCFDAPRWYRREVFYPLLLAAIALMGWAMVSPRAEYALGLRIAVFCAGLFVVCMFCHGELARLKPAPAYLTRFYLMVALGGACGSTLEGIVAPLALRGDFDLEIGLVFVALLFMWQVRRDATVVQALGIVAAITAVGCSASAIHEYYRGTLNVTRNFYGVLRVREGGEGEAQFRALIHGNIRHGTQYAKFRGYPTGYYAPTSGIGRLLSQRPSGLVPIRVGVVGLGIGTLAAYGLPGDVMRFYDIDPNVLAVAQRDFSYLRDGRATIELVLGDARLALEREPDQKFDVLAIDAFFGDSIPVHLLTTEAIDIYRRHLKPDGVLAIHITNRFLDLVPVVAALADAHGLFSVYVNDPNPREWDYASFWMLLSARRESLDRPKVTEAAKPFTRHPDRRLWTDDFNNLVQALK